MEQKLQYNTILAWEVRLWLLSTENMETRTIIFSMQHSKYDRKINIEMLQVCPVSSVLS